MRTEKHSLTIYKRVMSGSSLREFSSPLTTIRVSILTVVASGIPHSIQALDDGVEFLLVFDQGDFSEDNTFLATEVFLHSPVSQNSTLTNMGFRLNEQIERSFGEESRCLDLSL